MMQMLAGFRKTAHASRPAAPNRAVILVYHRVGEYQADPWALSVTPRHFAEHLRILRRQYHLMALTDLVAASERGAVPPNAVSVTFDDGYAETVMTVSPLLERFEIPATVFVVVDALDSAREFWWDELTQLLLLPGELPSQLELTMGEKNYGWELSPCARYTLEDMGRYQNVRAYQDAPTARHRAYQEIWAVCHQLPNHAREQVLDELAQQQKRSRTARASFRAMTRNQIASLRETGLIEIGAHTMTHPSLAPLPLSEQRREIFESKAQLESLIDAPIAAFSYPFGKPTDYSDETIRLVQQAGFDYACTNFSGVVSNTTDSYQLPRLFVPDCDGAQFAQRLEKQFQAVGS